jgi:hypothetical protein
VVTAGTGCAAGEAIAFFDQYYACTSLGSANGCEAAGSAPAENEDVGFDSFGVIPFDWKGPFYSCRTHLFFLFLPTIFYLASDIL